MLVTKSPQTIINSSLQVDDLKVEHEENSETGETDLIETYEGMVAIEKTQKQKYLVFSKRDKTIMNNIITMIYVYM